MTRLGEEARWLGQEVGSLRDLDVVADDIIRREAGLHLDEPGLTDLADSLSRRAAERRRDLRKLLVGARAQKFLLDLARFTETRGWLVPEDFDQTRRLAMPVADLSELSLGKCWKRVAKRAHGLETLTVEERHELRKALKKLRYATEFFSPSVSGEARRAVSEAFEEAAGSVRRPERRRDGAYDAVGGKRAGYRSRHAARRRLGHRGKPGACRTRLEWRQVAVANA